LIGTSTRPNALTPNSAIRKRVALGETIATRAPSATPSSSSAAARLRAICASSVYVIRPRPPPGGDGSSMAATRSP